MQISAVALMSPVQEKATVANVFPIIGKCVSCRRAFFRLKLKKRMTVRLKSS